MTDTAIFFGKAFVLCGLITVFVLPKIPPQHRKSYVLGTIGVWIFLQLLLFWTSTWFLIHLILDTLIIAAILFHKSKDLRQFAKMMGFNNPAKKFIWVISAILSLILNIVIFALKNIFFLIKGLFS